MQHTLSGCKPSDEQLYKRLFHAYFPELVMYATTLLKDKATAEDLVQELFITIWFNKKYPDVADNIEKYLYRALRNACLNHLRNEKRHWQRLTRFQWELENIDECPADLTEREREREELYRALHRLPPQCREIFLLCCLHDLTYQATADRLGVSINTVRTQMGRAFKYLRDSLRGKTFANLLFFVLQRNSQN